MIRSTRTFPSVVAALASIAALASPCRAADAPPAATTAAAIISADAAAPAAPKSDAPAAASFKPSFSIHGYLTAAYGKTSDGEILGVTREGTTDYMRAALQLRFEMTPKDTALIQLRHIQLGNSPSAQFKQDVELNWAYLEHRFTDNFRVRVGRTPIPYALDNELHSVGIVLPFYRLPTSIYPPDTFNHETLDGVHLTYEHSLHRDWSGAFDLYGGAVTTGNEYINLGDRVALNKVTIPNLRGARILVHNSDDTMQFYVSDLRDLRKNSALNGFIPAQSEVLSEGFHLRYRRFDLEAEHAKWATRGKGGSYFPHTGYVQLGYDITERWSVHGLAEYNRIDLPGLKEKGDFFDGMGGSVGCRLSPHVVWKAEAQRIRGYFEDVPVRNIVLDPQFHTTVFLTSISVAF